MRTINNGSSIESVSIRFRVKDESASWQDLSSRVFAINYSDDLEADACSITVKLRNNYGLYVSGTNNSLDPLDTNSSYYVSGHPLLGHQHECDLAVSKDGGVNWYTVFEGRVGPGVVSCYVDVDGDDVVEVSPVDITNRYKEHFWYDSLIYKDADAVSIMSQMMTDQGFRGTNDSVVEVDAPGFHVEEYVTGETSLWDAQKALIEPTGYIYRARWHAGSGCFRCCVYDPDRDNSTPDATFNGNFASRSIDVAEQDTRTKIIVRYRDRNYGTIKVAQDEDETARDKYGIPNGAGGRLHKTMWYSAEGFGERYSMIDTPAEAQTLASLILHDLKEPSPDTEIALNYIHPGIEVHDLLAFVGNDYTVSVGVTSYSWDWTVENPYGTSTVRGSADRIVGMSKTWLMKDSRSVEVRRDTQQAILAGDGKRPTTPDAPTIRSYWGTDSKTGKEVPITEFATTPVRDWDLSQYRWRYWIAGEDAPREETTREPRLMVTGLQAESTVRAQVRSEDWSVSGG